MKPKNSLTWLTSLFAFVAAADPLSAQTVAPSPAIDPVVELSPFVVDSTKDTGYQAMNTMAGTRLDVPLKDLGAAISIYTKDFLEDIGATDSMSLLIYATGMEAAGPSGNFSWAGGSNVNPIDTVAVSVSGGPARENRQASSRSRGIIGPTFTRNFFNSQIATDSYNVERITVLRGPNSALVGVSSPGGIVDSSLAEADVNHNRNKVSFRVDNNMGHRATADFNRVLIPGKLAARLIGLEAREEYNQRPAYQEDKRLYGSVTYKPFRNTTLRANFETGQMNANQPIGIVMMNSITNEWYTAGRPGFDWTFYDDPARNPNAAAQVSSNFYPYYMAAPPTQNHVAYYNNPDDKVPSYAYRVTFPTTTATAANAVRAGTFHPLLNRDTAQDTGRMVATRNIQELPAAAYWIGGNVPPGQQPGFQPPGLRIQAFTDPSVFDWAGRMIDESALFTKRFRTFSTSLAQTAWQNRLGVELAYDWQRQYNRSFAQWMQGNGSSNEHVRVDTSVILADGTPNPNLGRPFFTSQNFRWYQLFHDYTTTRATGFIKYDFKDLNESWGRWAGRHTLSGVVERFQSDLLNESMRINYDGPDVRNDASTITSRIFNAIAYVGPSLIGNNNPLRLSPIKIPRATPGPFGRISTFVRAADATDPGNYRLSDAALVPTLTNGQAAREVIKSHAFTLQSNWFDDHVATVAGWRKDDDHPATQNIGWTLAGVNNDPNAQGSLAPGFNDITLPHTPAKLRGAETKTYSIVAAWPKKLIPLPRGMEFALSWNKSENFSPLTQVGVRTDAYGVILPPPKGITDEYGINMSMFNNKLVVRVNKYETAGQFLGINALAGNGGPTMVVSAIANWTRESNTNPHLQPMRDADINKLKAALPADLFTLYDYRVTGTAPNIVITTLTGPPTGTYNTTDYSSKGVEVELVYNPTNNWRILTNITKQESIKSNTAPFLKAWRDHIMPVWATLGDKAFGNYPLGWQIGTPLPATTETVAQAVDRLLTTPLATDVATEGQPTSEQREWRVNLVTNYRFNSSTPFLGERLKGWSIGGAIRWQSEFTLGYPTSRTAAGVPVFDTGKPWMAPADLNLDAFVSYERKIWNNRIDWKLQINATNLYRPHDLIPVGSQPWGQVAAYRVAPEARWYLNNTFSF